MARKDTALEEVSGLFQQTFAEKSALRSLSMLDVVAWGRLRAQHKKAFYECLASLPPANAPEDARRLDDLLYCLPYARAAYGFAMYMGYLETPLQCALLPVDAVTQGFDARVADANTQLASLCELCGRQRSDVILSSFDASTFRPAFAVLVDADARTIVVTIRGSLHVEDVLTDVAAGVDEDPDLGGAVHAGILRSAKWVVARVQPALRAQKEERPHYRIVVTGHSLGAGVAALTALLLDSALDAEAFVFACPSVADPAVSKSPRAQARVTNVVHGRDWIPRLSVKSVQAVLHDVSMLGLQTLAVDAVGKIAGGRVRDYAERRKLPPETAALQLPVGATFWVVDINKDAGARVLRAEPEHFGSVFVHEKMFADHLPSRYETGLRAVCAARGVRASAGAAL